MERREILRGTGTLVAAVTGVGGASTAAGRHTRPTVQIIRTNEPVQGGQWLNVTARITNHGRLRLQGYARCIVGRDPTEVDNQYVSLASGRSTTVTLGYRTYPVQTTDVFPVRIECENGFDSRTVTVDPAP